MQRVLVTGAGGFIGHHLVTYLKEHGYWVRGVDIKYPEYTNVNADEFELLDLRRRDEALLAARGVEQVYALAADMGGMGFISGNHATILHNNALINLHTIEAARFTVSSGTYTAPRRASTPSTFRPILRSRRSARRTPTRRNPRTPTAGRS